MLTETNQNPKIQQIQGPSTADDECTSHSTLTPEEILSMKQQNPTTLINLQKLRQAPTEVHPSTSTSMPTPEMDTFVTLKLQQLKNYLFMHDVLAIIEEEEALELDILKLLDELARHKLPALVAKYLIVFETFFMQLVKDLALCRHSDFQVKTKINKMR